MSKKEEKQVRQTLARLTLDEKIGQLIVINTTAVFMNRDSDEYKELQHQVVDNKIGGLILSRSEVFAAAVLTNHLQQMAKVPLLTAADLEMGPGMRLDDTTWWPPNMAIAATGDPKYAKLQGSYTALTARAGGINWLYAPVADVNNNPDNPIINVRSYGEDPQMVATFASAFIDGAQGSGVLTTAKHFPGHGDTTTDSHLGLPVVDVTRERLDQLEFVPFRAAIASGVSAIMAAHVALPQIEPQLPATLSHKILTGLLREELRFKGLIVTDAMDMAGVAAHYRPDVSAVEAVKAGADMILECCGITSPHAEAAILGIKQAVADGVISESRINLSVERILRAKAALGLFERRTVDLNEVDRIISAPEFDKSAQEAANHSITLVKDEHGYLPISATKVLNITFTDDENRDVMRPFAEQLRRSGLQVDAVALDNRSTDQDIEQVRGRLVNLTATAVIYCVSVRTEADKGTVALPATGLRLADVISKSDQPVIVISFGNPYLLSAIPNTPAYIAAYGNQPVSQRAAAQAVVGEIAISGKLPVTIPGLYTRGQGIQVKAKPSLR
jgi:beta-N-acetylhexosaminidase